MNDGQNLDADLEIVLERSDADALSSVAKIFEVLPVDLLERCKLGDVIDFAYGEIDETYEVLAAMRQPDLEKAKRVSDRVKAFYPDCDVFAVDVMYGMREAEDSTVYTVIVDDDGSYGRNSPSVVYVSEGDGFRPFLIRGLDKTPVSITIKLTNGKYLVRKLEEWKKATGVDVAGCAVHSFSIRNIMSHYYSDYRDSFVRLLLPLLSWGSEQDVTDAGRRLGSMYWNEFVFYRYKDGERHKLALRGENALYAGDMIFEEVKPKPLPVKEEEPNALERACGWLNRKVFR